MFSGEGAGIFYRENTSMNDSEFQNNQLSEFFENQKDLDRAEFSAPLRLRSGLRRSIGSSGVKHVNRRFSELVVDSEDNYNS